MADNTTNSPPTAGQSKIQLDEKTFVYGILYIALYKLGIITAGILSIYFGYRLYLSGLFPYAVEGASFEAEVAGSTFTLQNAAPGTFFALFGVIVIVVMIIQNPPEFSYKSSTGEELRTRGLPPDMAQNSTANTTSGSAASGSQPAGSDSNTLSDEEAALKAAGFSD